MARITRLLLDILKPHNPDVVAFARHLAETATGLEVNLRVVEIDEQTQTLEVDLEGHDLDLETIGNAIAALGGSLHSIDGVRVINDDSTN